MTTQLDTIIIAGGQWGLSTSYYLKRQGREHIILEQADQCAQVWRNRWDSFTLNAQLDDPSARSVVPGQ